MKKLIFDFSLRKENLRGGRDFASVSYLNGYEIKFYEEKWRNINYAL